MTRSQDIRSQIATLFERLDNFIQSQEERHKAEDKSFADFAAKMEGYFRIKIGQNGSSREYDLKDIVINHEAQLKSAMERLSNYDKRRALFDLVEKHPKLSLLIGILVGLGLYFAGTQGLLIKIITSLKPF